MIDFLNSAYLWLKAFHVVSVIAWMAGLFYLPRLFIYHVEAAESETVQIDTFITMERRLLKAIMNPAMITSWIFGLLIVISGVIDWQAIWPWIKALMVIIMTWFHMWLGSQRKKLEMGQRPVTSRGYRVMNEVPTLLMLVIVIMAVVEPF